MDSIIIKHNFIYRHAWAPLKAKFNLRKKNFLWIAYSYSLYTKKKPTLPKHTQISILLFSLSDKVLRILPKFPFISFSCFYVLEENFFCGKKSARIIGPTENVLKGLEMMRERV